MRPALTDIKNPGKPGAAGNGTAFAMHPASTQHGARGHTKDDKMESETTNLFTRRDTFFGICEAVGQDFGFNPLWLRLAFVAPLFFFPVQTFAGYFALGLVVLASRLFFPSKIGDAAPAAATVIDPARRTGETTEELALAA